MITAEFNENIPNLPTPTETSQGTKRNVSYLAAEYAVINQIRLVINQTGDLSIKLEIYQSN